MSTLLLSSDLMAVSKAQGAATRTGCSLKVAANSAALLQQAAEVVPKLVILDLGTPAVEPADLVPQLKNLLPAATILAFGPHVHEGRLAAASQAGCDLVIARGQFHAQIEQLLRQYG